MAAIPASAAARDRGANSCQEYPRKTPCRLAGPRWRTLLPDRPTVRQDPAKAARSFTAPKRVKTVRIGTYNVLGLTGFPPQAARALLADAARAEEHFGAVFAALNSDVLGLQEGPPLERVRRIAERQRLYVVCFPSPGAWPGYVLSRHPILESRVWSHPGPGGRDGPFSRTAGAARLQVGTGDLWVVDVHLHPSDRALRAQEAKLLAAHLDGLGAGPTVVLGDLNSEVGEPVHRMLSGRGLINAMERAGGGIVPTMDTAGVRLLAIDHIYVSPVLAGHLRSARVVRDPGFRQDAPAPEGSWVHSDHLPVLAELGEP